MIDAPSSGCRVIRSHSCLSRRVRLEQDGVRHGELADVVEESRVPERLELVGRESELGADRKRDLLYPP